MDFEKLRQELKNLEQPAYRFSQIYKAVFCDLVENFDKISVLPKELRKKLAEEFAISSLKLVALRESQRGFKKKNITTKSDSSGNCGNSKNSKIKVFKTLFELEDKNQIESVLILDKDSRTVCVSSQVGCPMGCLFCATGHMGFLRNLSAQEIYDQVLYWARFVKQLRTEEVGVAAQKMMSPSGHGPDVTSGSEGESFSDDPPAGADRSGSACDHLRVNKITNIVFMGMGEPFLNYDNAVAAIRILNDKKGFNFGQRRMSISTCGIIPGIKKFVAENLEVNLAISLHAPDDELRSRLMPINKKYPLANLISVCRDYVKRTGRKLFFEYIMLAGINDSKEQAQQLARLLSHPLFHVNLIKYNFTGPRFQPSDQKTTLNFQKELQKQDVHCTIRKSAGSEIWAGCGQLGKLKTKNEK